MSLLGLLFAVRDGTLDIKALIETRSDLERRQPRVKCEFPLTAAMLEGEVLPQLGVAMSQPSRETYALNQFLKEIVPAPTPAFHVDEESHDVFRSYGT